MPQLLLDSLKAGSGLENSWLYSALKTVLLRSHRPMQEASCPSAALFLTSPDGAAALGLNLEPAAPPRLGPGC